MLIAALLFAVSGSITYGRHDLTEIYQQLHYPASQVAAMQAFPLGRRWMQWSLWIFQLPFLGYLLWIGSIL